MVDTVTAIVAAIVIIGLLVAFHLTRGLRWQPREDITNAILEHRAASYVEPEYPTPMSRAPGAGMGGPVAIPGEGAEGELEDSGEAEAVEAGPWTKPDDEAEVFDIEYVKEGATLEVPENQTLLEAGEDQGWDLPYACREGQCLSCGAHIPDGPADDLVVHNNQQMLEQGELDDGYILSCCAYPKGSFALETSETP